MKFHSRFFILTVVSTALSLEQSKLQHRIARKLIKESESMSELSVFRLYLLRAGYILIAFGVAIMIFPGIINPPENLSNMGAVVRSMLGAVSLLAFLGIRYPLKMLPLLLFELIWKTIWLVAFGIRLWSADKLDQDTSQRLDDCIFGVIVVLLVTPWDYVFKHYLKASGERWRKQSVSSPTDKLI